jgi:hypothetical protein
MKKGKDLEMFVNCCSMGKGYGKFYWIFLNASSMG